VKSLFRVINPFNQRVIGLKVRGRFAELSCLGFT
jgi:hypothetical protein